MSEPTRPLIGAPPSPAAMPETAAQPKEDWAGFARFLLKLALVVLLFRTLVFTSFNIPSESMMPRLLVGDYLFAAKWPYGYSRHSLPFPLDLGDGRVLARQPERGDIVIFKHPLDHTDYIKRVIGLPGDRVQLINGVVHLNGQPLPRERVEDLVLPFTGDGSCARVRFVVRLQNGGYACRYPQYRESLPGGVSYLTLDFGAQEGLDNTPPVVVPEGHLFLMGDNRDNSLDSRYPAEPGRGIGLVPQANLVGRASFLYFSVDGTGHLLLPWTWPGAIRWSRIGRSI